MPNYKMLSVERLKEILRGNNRTIQEFLELKEALEVRLNNVTDEINKINKNNSHINKAVKDKESLPRVRSVDAKPQRDMGEDEYIQTIINHRVKYT